MALVTVQRSPSPSNSPEHAESEGDAVGEDDRSPARQRRSKTAIKRLRKFFNTIRFITKLSPRFSESYFAVKGTALILPQSECARKVTTRSHGGDIQYHLQCMLHLLRPQDTLKVAVKLESTYPNRNRYMAVVSCVGRQDTDECLILGIDCNNERATIGLVLPIWSNSKIILDGDGGFSINFEETHHLFKPVNVQAMWSALQSLHKVVAVATANHYYPQGLTHTWVGYYEARISSDQPCISEWHLRQDIMQFRDVHWEVDENSEQAALKAKIRSSLREIMMTVDLEEVTSKFLRVRLEEVLDRSLQEYKSFVDEEMLIIMGQMDAPSGVFDFLYLGSEWNASNLDELKENGIGFILNMTREIDNFFPGMFTYMNIREYDVEETDLLKYWEKTYKFINKARKAGSKVLVHCKMGVSRSASTVIAFLMKDKGWSLEETIGFVKSKRSCIKPNKSFMKQLETYQGILNASRKRFIFKSKSESNLLPESEEAFDELTEGEELNFLGPPLHLSRPHSWTNEDDIAARIMQQKALAMNDGGETSGSGMFQLGGEDADVEVSSRSTDSVEMSLPDIPSPKTVKPEDDNTRLFDLELNGPRQMESGVRSGIYSPRKLSPFPSPVGSPQNENLFLPVPNQGMGLSSSWTPSSIPFAFKVRDDSSWIKEASPDTPVTAQPLGTEEAPSFMTEDTNKNVGFYIGEPDPETEGPNSSYCAMDQTLMPSAISEQFMFHSTPYIGNQAEPSKPLLDINPHYVREEIPWHPGTVKKQLKDFEHRFRNSDGTESDVPIVIEPSSSEVYVAQNRDMCSPWTLCSESSSSSLLQPRIIHQSQTCPIVVPPSSEVPPTRPISVYEMEDIPLPVGIVQRTKQEIEEKQRPTPREWVETSFSDLDPVSKPVQRSSSLKTSASKTQSRKLRSSERRKTCTPVLSPCNSPDTSVPPQFMTNFISKVKRELILSDSNTNSQLDAHAVQVFKYGSEAVPLELGKVKRHAQDYENLKQDAKAVAPEDEMKHDEAPQPEKFILRPQKVSTTVEISEGQNLDVQPEAVFVDKTAVLSSVEMTDLPFGPGNVPVLSVEKVKLRTVKAENVSSDASPISSTSTVTPPAVREGSSELRSHRDFTTSIISQSNQTHQTNVTMKVPKESRLDKAQLLLIRQIGSALLNQPIKTDEVEKDGGSMVKQIVNQIQTKSEVKPKSFLENIVIIEKEVSVLSSQPSGQVKNTSPKLSSPSAENLILKSLSTATISLSLSETVSVNADITHPTKPTSLSVVKSTDFEISDKADVETSACTSPATELPFDGLETIEDHLVKNLVGKFEIKDSREDVKKVSDIEDKCAQSSCLTGSEGSESREAVLVSPKSEQHPPLPTVSSSKPVPRRNSLEDLWTMHRVSDAEHVPLDFQASDQSHSPDAADQSNSPVSFEDPTSDTSLVEMRTFSSRQRPSSVIVTSTHSLGALSSSEPGNRRSIHCLSSLNSSPSNPHQFLPSDSQNFTLDGRKVRRLEGKTHPLAKLGWQHSTL